jgi:excinuclease UvrABC helicase subunit UvrB
MKIIKIKLIDYFFLQKTTFSIVFLKKYGKVIFIKNYHRSFCLKEEENGRRIVDYLNENIL